MEILQKFVAISEYMNFNTKFDEILLPKIPQILFGRSAQSTKIFGIFEKKLYWVSAVRVAAQVRYNIGENRVRIIVKVQCKYSEKKM